ncbi:hypothetical protein ACKWTF_007636 [Chironomus riparius]
MLNLNSTRKNRKNKKSNNMSKILETQCCKCGGSATKNNTLVECEFVTCLKVIHDNCNDHPVRIDGDNKFVCDEHRARFEQDQQEKAEHSVQEVDLTSVEPPKNSEENSNLQEKTVNPELKDDNVTRRSKKFLCAICKDEEATSSTILVTCISCNKIFHDVCLAKFGEFNILNGVVLCVSCNSAKYDIEKSKKLNQALMSNSSRNETDTDQVKKKKKNKTKKIKKPDQPNFSSDDKHIQFDSNT